MEPFSQVLTGKYDQTLLIASFIVSVFGSWLALTIATKIRQADGSILVQRAIIAGIALGGIGVWSMHFVGMVAMSLNAAVAYSTVETLISLIAACVAASAALVYVGRDTKDRKRLLVAGVLLGLGVAVMHYLGMYGVKINGYIRWDYSIVAISIVIAIAAATAALWLSFAGSSPQLRFVAAVVMGIAVCSMHYTGMAAAEFICTTPNLNVLPQGLGFVPRWNLSFLLTGCLISVLLIVMMTLMYFPVKTQKAS
jgi:NO-binding membrane sensor protein with MHYT domain